MRYLKNYELENMGKEKYPKKDFEEQLKELFESLTTEETKQFVYRSVDVLKEKNSEKGTKWWDLTQKIVISVLESKKLSFKQFKAINAYCKILNVSDTIYKTWQ